MRTRFKIYSWTLITVLVLLGTGYAQTTQDKTPADSKPIAEDAALDEKLVRLAYRKLEVYSAVAKHGKGNRSINERLRFRLSNFRSDRIEELRSSPYNTVITPPSEEIIQLFRSGESLNDGQEQVSYSASWSPGRYGAMFDRNWTMGDVLRFEAAAYFEVNRYTSYTVEVSFEGKERVYQALVFHHGTRDDRRLEFLDTIVGIGGTLTSVWKEQHLPAGFDDHAQRNPKREPLVQNINRFIAQTKRALSVEEESISCPIGSALINECTIAKDLAAFWDVDASRPWVPKSRKTSAPSSAADLVPIPDLEKRAHSEELTSELDVLTWYATDYRGHISGTGGHYGWAQFAPRCTSLPSNMQRCEVLYTGPQHGDNPDHHTDWWHHVGTGRAQSNPRTGPRGQNIECETGVGVAFDTCATSGCGVSMTLGITGQGTSASVTISGGTLWSSGRAEGLVCNLPRDPILIAGGCNEPATFGCLPGFVEVGGFCTRSLSFMSQCTRFGDYDADACACTGGCAEAGLCSPIVVDVLGNGFNMTSASTGVFFDMAGQGNAERYSWTAENSDDAWLVLDRNNNGLIDSGKELFGNVTGQDIHAEGVERNGFLALALYDSPAYGGNGDGIISRLDAVFSRLKLWRDDNHNGVSESCELFALPDLGLEKIELDYRSSRRVDEHGNEFRYRSKVWDSPGSNIGRWAWDVFLVRQP